MANRIKLIRIDGNDVISKSMETINQNYSLLEDTINAQMANDIRNLRIEGASWTTSMESGPVGTITLSNGNTTSINPIPAADRDQSGIVTAGPQTIGGLKKFEHGIVTDAISDEKGRYIVLSDENKVYIGGENGIILQYEGDTLSGIYYSGKGDGTDTNLIGDINYLKNRLNSESGRLSDFETALNSVRTSVLDSIQTQETKIDNLSTSLSSYATSVASIQNQTDRMIEHWFGEFGEMDELKSAWISSSTGTQHTDDTFTVVEPKTDAHYKECYRFTGSVWVLMSETEYDSVVQALINSLDAMSIADGKCTTFYAKFPPFPCHIGDIWITSDPFYLNGGEQVFTEPTSSSDSDDDIIPADTVLFCIKDNETNSGSMSDWSLDMKTWSQIQFEKEVETKFDETDEAIDNVKTAIDDINDDNTFCIFEKNDFLHNTWYPIAGSYKYEPSRGSITNGHPSPDFLGTSEGASFRDSISDYIGDIGESDEIDDTTPIDQIVVRFRALGEWLDSNHLFDDSLKSTEFVTSLPHDEDSLGRVAKQELSELLYHYYREEEECRKQAYVAAVTTMINDIQNQSDSIIQNWYMPNIPLRQDEMPWRKPDESIYDYTVNDRKHIDDTLVNLGDGKSVYKFCESDTPSDPIGQNDKRVYEKTFYWKQISRSDIDTIMEELNINTSVATADGTVNVFNTLPHDYSYGDIWFCRGGDPDLEDGYNSLSQEDRNRFKAGCIYYCSREVFPDGSDDDSLPDRVRRNFVGNDWSNGYEQGEEFITSFAEMMSDDHLTPVEKSQIFREWYEIAGFNLIGGDNDTTDNIAADAFDQNNGGSDSNTGSFRCLMNNASKLLRNGQTIQSPSDFNTFIQTSGDENSSVLMQTLRNVRDRFVTLQTALVQCGVNDMNSTTDLSHKEFSGIDGYNGPWSPSRHITMLPDLFTQYYLDEDNAKTIMQNLQVQAQIEDLNADFVEFTESVDNLLAGLGGQGGENGDYMIQNWFGTDVPTEQDRLPWRNVSETESDYDTNDHKHRDDIFVKSIGGITEIYRFSTGVPSVSNGDVSVVDSPLHWKKISSADIQTIHQYLGIDTELAGADGSVNIFNTLPHNYTYGDIWFCGEDYPSSSNPTFKNGCIYYCSNSALTTTPRAEFTASDWSSGYTYADSFISEFSHFTDDNWLTQIEKDQLVSKWHEISGVDIFGNDNTLSDSILEDIFNNNQDSGGSFRSAVNCCAQLYDNINSVGTYSAYGTLKTRVSDDYPELGTLMTTLESKLNDVRSVLIACNCHESGEQDLTSLSFSFTEASLNAYNGTWNSNKNGSMFSEIFTRYYLAESNVIEKVRVIQNTSLQEMIDGFGIRIETAEDAIENAESAINAINDDNIFSISEKNSFLTNTFLPISGNRAYDTTADVTYTTIGSTSCPESRPTQISDFLGTSQNGSFIRTIDSVWPSTLTEASNNIKVRVGELVSAYKNLAKLCKNNGLFETTLTSTQFRNSSNSPVDGPTGKRLLSEALYNYKREENECNKLLYIDSVSNMISSLTNQLDGQAKRYYKNSTPPSTTDGCSMLFVCDQSEFESHLNDEYIDMSSNNDVYLFVKKDDISETISNPNIDVENTLYYWKKVSNSSLQNLIDRIDGFEQTLAQNDGVINIFNTVPGGNKPYSYGDIWFCNSDYPPGSKTFEKDHMYWCFDTTAQNVTTFNPNQWKSAYPYGDEKLAQLAHITDDNYVSTIEKSSLIQKWCEITGGNDVPVSLNMSIIMNNSTNVGSFRSVISDWYSSFNTNSLNYSNYDSVVSQNSSSPHRSVVIDLVKKLNDVRKALELCGCVGENATEGTSVNGLDVPYGAFQYSGNMNFNENPWNNSILPTVFATYYFEETNLRTLVQKDNAQSVATTAANVVQQNLNSINSSLSSRISAVENQAGSSTEHISDDGVFSMDEKIAFLYGTWKTISGSTDYLPDNDGNDYLTNDKLEDNQPYLGTSVEGSFRRLLQGVGGFSVGGNGITHGGNGDDQIDILITKFKKLGEECDAHGLFEEEIHSTEFSEAGESHDIDDLYDALYQYYNMEEVLRQHLQENVISEAVSALYGQEDGTIAIYSKDTLPPSTGQGLLNLWFNGSVPSGVTVGNVVGNHIGDEYRYTSPSNPKNYVFSTGTAGTDDIAISDVNGYMWKVSSESSLSELITQVQQLADGYSVDGVVNIFGPEKLPTSYDYGDIWFFGGAEVISPALNSQEIHNYGLDGEKWVAGNVYYCCTGDSDSEPFTGFDTDNWECGVQGSILAQMTDDDWLSVNEKQILLSKWYDITGVDFYSFTNNSNYQTPGSLITALENNPNANTNGSFQTISDQYSYVTGLDSNGGSSEPGGGGNQGGTPAEETITEEEQAEQETIQNMLNEINIDGGVVGKDCLVFEIREGLEDKGYYLGVVSEDGFSYNILRGFSQTNDPGVYTVNDGSINTGMYLGESFSIDSGETYISNVNILQVRFIEKDCEPDDFIEIENIGRIGSDVGNDAISITIRNDSNEITIHSENGINLYGYSFEKIPFDQIDIDNMSDDDNCITVHDVGDVGEECPHTLYVYISINSPSTDIQAVEDCMTQLQSDLWNIYTILYRCECGDTTNGKYLGGVSVSGLQSPFNGKTGYITNNRTIISDIFNQYYSDEQNLRVEMTEFEIQTTDPMEGLAEDNGDGLLLTSYIKLKYDGVVTGGLNGITAENNNVGLWFGGSYNAAKNGMVPLNITKTGYGSKIGPLTVGGSSSANEHIFIGNENSGDVTVIGKDYISLGAGYSNSNTSGKAERNSVIYLNSGGYGSKIGPLTVGRNGITFGANLPVYRFKHSNAGDFSCELQPSTSSYNIDGYTNFTQNDLNLTATNGVWCSPTGVSVSVTVDITNGAIK